MASLVSFGPFRQFRLSGWESDRRCVLLFLPNSETGDRRCDGESPVYGPVSLIKWTMLRIWHVRTIDQQWNGNVRTGGPGPRNRPFWH